MQVELPQTLEACVPRDCELIALVGEIDMTRAAELRAAVEAYRRSQSGDARVDMSEVSFCGSEDVEFLVSCLRPQEQRSEP
jgi:anti-anti-sigma regulatory factor